MDQINRLSDDGQIIIFGDGKIEKVFNDLMKNSICPRRKYAYLLI